MRLALVFVLVLGQVYSGYAIDSPLISEQKQSVNLKRCLKQIPGVESVKKMTTCDHFTAYYEIWFEQLTDPKDPNSETFLQRVLLGHTDFESPVVVELQGYDIYTKRAGEMANLFNANQLTIEHRYFDNSKPRSGIPWQTLTVENAAYDQHIIIDAIKTALYSSNKFISTGISKGGQTTMIHRSFYPEDVDASVCYVAPLNFTREDTRIYDFLNSVSTAEDREKVREFQIICFERKDRLVKRLQHLAEEKGFSWDMGLEKAFEFYVLEYSFAFWQWGDFEVSQIPNKEADDTDVLNHLLQVSGISFFERGGVENLRPYFWAALTEMGIYGYEYEPFKAYLSQQSDYKFDFAFPEGITQTFDPEPMRKLNDFIQNKAEKTLFIYGELDTWSATGVELSQQAIDRGLKKYVLKGGHHGARIRHFDKATQEEIVNTIKVWMAQE